ncbi:MAG: histidine phosphatase family protein [Acidobacteriota bacterium]
MSRFFLVRHGETIYHEGNRYAGSSDIPLTPKGEQQAQTLAAWASHQHLTHLYASNLSRAIATAQPTAQLTGLELHVDPRLREICFGRAEGLTDAQQQAQFPEARAAFLADPAANFLPEGEPPVEAAHRARTVLTELSTLHGPDARILVVAHNTLIRLLLCDLLGIALSRYRTVFPSLRNTAVTEIKLTPETFSLLSFNTPL